MKGAFVSVACVNFSPTHMREVHVCTPFHRLNGFADVKGPLVYNVLGKRPQSPFIRYYYFIYSNKNFIEYT